MMLQRSLIDISTACNPARHYDPGRIGSSTVQSCKTSATVPRWRDKKRMPEINPNGVTKNLESDWHPRCISPETLNC